MNQLAQVLGILGAQAQQAVGPERVADIEAFLRDNPEAYGIIERILSGGAVEAAAIAPMVQGNEIGLPMATQESFATPEEAEAPIGGLDLVSDEGITY